VAVIDDEAAGFISSVWAYEIGREVGFMHIVGLAVKTEMQNKGIGTKLIEYTKQLSKNMGYKAIIIYGDPDYYKRFGFKASKEYNITNKDGKFPAALLVLELYPDALKGIEGVFDEGKVYEVDEKEAEDFDKSFCAKEKTVTKSQERFLEMVGKFL
jgi:predicted N-acetyltransferase YhbS